MMRPVAGTDTSRLRRLASAGLVVSTASLCAFWALAASSTSMPGGKEVFGVMFAYMVCHVPFMLGVVTTLTASLARHRPLCAWAPVLMGTQVIVMATSVVALMLWPSVSIAAVMVTIAGLWLVWKQSDTDPKRCMRCGYDLLGLSAPAVCPECGSRVLVCMSDE
jgi:DNA-directed RNA polymerase subunit RPC12/RpoP